MIVQLLLFWFLAVSTLRRWTSDFEVEQGLLNNVIMLMKHKARSLPEVERLCAISFDEVYISNKIEIDKKEEQTFGPHKTCQVVMARGILGNWKQPIYYKFDQPMTAEIIKEIITALYNARFTVVSMVSDMGTSNTKVWSQLNIEHDKNCFFEHPVDQSLKVYVFADTPHLLKLARNHLFDDGKINLIFLILFYHTICLQVF